MQEEKKPASWFTNRIGRTVYRTEPGGQLVTLPIHDHAFAMQLYRYEAEGLVVYRDKP
jgi:hypothetical protein